MFIFSTILLFAVYAYRYRDPLFGYFFSSGLPPILAFAALALAVSSVPKMRITGGSWLSRAWIGYTLGILLWFLGELTWAIYSFLLGVAVPFPSLGDVFWLSGYIPFLFAFISQFWLFRGGLSLKHIAIVATFTIVLSGFVLGILIPPATAGTDSVVSLVVSAAYPLLDIISLAFALPILLFGMNEGLWRPLRLMILGMILSLVGDIMFGWASVTGTYFQGHPSDLLFNWAYMVFAFGFYLKLKQSR